MEQHGISPAHPYPGPALPTEQDIRLLSTLPGANDEPIRCTLTIRKNTPYEALSYVCDNQSIRKSITIEGVDETEQDVSVTSSCYAAL